MPRFLDFYFGRATCSPCGEDTRRFMGLAIDASEAVLESGGYSWRATMGLADVATLTTSNGLRTLTHIHLYNRFSWYFGVSLEKLREASRRQTLVWRKNVQNVPWQWVARVIFVLGYECRGIWLKIEVGYCLAYLLNSCDHETKHKAINNL